MQLALAFSAFTAELFISSDNDLQIFLEVLYQKLVQVPKRTVFYKDTHINLQQEAKCTGVNLVGTHNALLTWQSIKGAALKSPSPHSWKEQLPLLSIPLN